MANAVHHVELWTTDLGEVEASWTWLFASLGWTAESWTNGRTFTHPDGTYVVLEQSPAVTSPHDRMRAGLNHLALTCADRSTLDVLRADAEAHGWAEMFADAYPHAGGPQHTALFVENGQGFEVEIVADPPLA